MSLDTQKASGARLWKIALRSKALAPDLWGYVKSIIVFAVIFFATFHLPENVVSNIHDAGSQATLEYFLIHHFSYGEDVIQNVGPYGFVAYPDVFTGMLDLPKLILNLLLSGLIAFMATRWFHKFQSTLASLVWIIAICSMAIHDAVLYLLVFLLCQELFLTTDGHNKKYSFGRALYVVSLAFLALMKGTFFFIGIFALLGCVVSSFARNKGIYGAVDFVIFFSAVILLWILAGQSVDALLLYPKVAIEFSSGYNEAMTIYEHSAVTIAGFLVLSMLSFGVIIRDIEIRRWTRIPLILVQLLIIFVAWKHGFVRADGHVQVFFSFAMAASVMVFWGHPNVHDRAE